MEPLQALIKAVQESQNAELPEYPGMFSRAVNHPGVLGYETKTPEEWQADQRKAYILSRVSEAYQVPYAVHSLRNYAKKLNDKDASSELRGWADDLSQYSSDPSQIESAYRYRGALSPGQPLHNALTWVGSAGSYVNDVGPRALANLADYAVSSATGGEYHPPHPTALRDARRNANTFLFQVPEMVGLYENGSHMDTIARNRDERSRVNSMAYSELAKNLLSQREDLITANILDEGMSDNVETLEQHGAPKYVSIPVGTVFNAATDPFAPGAFLGAAKMPLKMGLKALATDFGPELALRAIPEVLREEQ